ncbi:MAG: hypothetical protein L6305_02085, partial [Actinomycetia bacterium]|nr:hypothetical protein [Actinomycetes bacterium]
MMTIKPKRTILFISLIVFALILIKPINAVGIYFPVNNEMDFKPGLEKTLDFAVTSSNLDVRLSVS